MTNIICIFLLIAPSVAYKLYSDRDGFDHRSNGEFINVCLISLISICFAMLIKADFHTSFKWYTILFLKCFLVSVTGFGLFFNYLFNLFWSYKIFRRNYFKNRSRLIYIFDNLNEDVIPDKWIKGIHWGIRLSIYVLLFTSSIIWFIS